MTRRFVFLLLLLTASAGATELVGLTVPPYPDGLVGGHGACVGRSLGLKKECDYSIAVLQSADETPSAIVGTRLKGRDDQRKAIWIIMDTVPYPSIPEGHLLTIASCQVDGKDDQTIVAVVRNHEEEEWLKELLWARRFDLTTEKFVEQPTAGVRCRNEAAGL